MNIKLIVVALLAIILLPILVLAAQINPENPASIAEVLAAAIKNAEYVIAALVGAIALIWILRKSSGWLANRVSALSFLLWLTSDRGGALLALLTGALVTLITALSAGASMNLALVLAAILGALPAGWFVVGKKIAAPSDSVTATSADVVVYKGRVYKVERV